jgi:hypothetical protein
MGKASFFSQLFFSMLFLFMPAAPDLVPPAVLWSYWIAETSPLFTRSAQDGSPRCHKTGKDGGDKRLNELARLSSGKRGPSFSLKAPLRRAHRRIFKCQKVNWPLVFGGNVIYSTERETRGIGAE